MAVDARRVKELFGAAIDIPEASAREVYLDRECGNDSELRQRLQALLKAHEAPASAVNQPLAGEGTVAYAASEKPGMIAAGRYKLLESIGEGGMGTVFVAEQTEPVKRKVAVKLIKPGMDSKSVLARFEAERQALAMMNHPNIAKVLDAGLTEERRPYFVMEYIKGLPLTKYCDDVKLSIDERLKLFIQICQAVQHAHQKGIIHRDLKPGNILIALYDGKPVPKIIDFGLAKALHHSLTDRTLHTGHEMVLGTPLYMSPEQAELNNLDIDTRSDIYSLGVILYEMLTGVTPLEKKRFKEAAWAEVLRIIKEEEPSKPSTKLSQSNSLPSVAAQRQMEPKRLSSIMKGDLDWIVMKALEKDRSRRYETANGFAADLLRYLSGEVVTAVPPSAGYRLQKFVRRNKGKVIAASLVLFALLAGMAGTTWGLIEARRQEEFAVGARDEAVAAQKRSDSDRAEAVAIKNFVVDDMLGMTNGWAANGDPGERGPNVTVRTLLDRASRRVGPQFADRPLVEAGVRTAIGDSYNAIGLQREALVHAERVVAIYRQYYGPDDLRTLNAIGELASHYQHQMFDSDRAEPLAREALLGYERIQGPDGENTIGAMATLASILEPVGRNKEGDRIRLDAYDRSLRVLGPDNITTANLRTTMVYLHIAKRNFAAAEPLAVDGLSRNLRVFGENHPVTHFGARALGTVYYESGRLDRATELMKEWVAKARHSFGEQAGDTLWALHDLARIYMKGNRFAEAALLLEQAYAGFNRSAGSTNTAAMLVAAMLVECYARLGRSADAVALLEKSGTGKGTDANWLYNAACMYAIVSGQVVRPEEAERYAIRAIALLREATARGWADTGRTVADSNLVALIHRDDFRVALAEMGKKRPGSYPNALATLGLKLIDKKYFTEAEPLLRECLAIREKTQPDMWSTFNTQSLLGGAFMGQKKYADAEPLLLKGYEGMKAREKTIPPQGATRIREAIDRLIQLYTETNKPDEVKKWQAEKDKLPKAVEKKN